MKRYLLILSLVFAACVATPVRAHAQSPAAALAATLQSAATTDGVGTAANVTGYSSALIQVTGTVGTATVTFKISGDGTNYTAVMAYPISGAAGATSTTSTGQWFVPILGARKLEAPITGSGGGTSLTVTARAVASGGGVSGGGSGGGGTVTQGTAAAAAGGWPVWLTDLTNLLGVAAHPVRTDPTGTTTQPISGTVTANAGSGSFTVTQGTAANLKVDLSGTAANATALKVDGSAATQPVSGSVTVTQGTAANLKVQAASTATPTWTDSVSVVAAATLARGSTTRGTWDLRTAKGGYLFLRLGRGGTTALASIGAEVLIRRVIGNGAAGGTHPAGTTLVSGITAANGTTVASDSASGQAVLNATSGTGFAADQIICIQDSGGGVTRLEFARISKISGATITLDSNLNYTHTAVQADTIRNQADVFTPVWLDGGSLWEVIIDYGQQSAGESLTVQAQGQTYASDTYQ